jgi:hypothetical protein
MFKTYYTEAGEVDVQAVLLENEKDGTGRLEILSRCNDRDSDPRELEYEIAHKT